MTYSCVKCTAESTVQLNRKDFYCRPCFIHYVTHRFRATLGKRKVFNKKDEEVLIAFSGGSSSSALLDLVQKATEALDDKRLKVKPSVLHLIEHRSIDEKLLVALQQFSGKFPVKIGYLADALYLLTNPFYSISDFAGNSPTCNEDAQQRLCALLDGVRSETSLLDLYRHIKSLALRYCASKLGFSFLLIAESSTHLATDCLIDVSLGRGDQIVQRVDLVEKFPQISNAVMLNVVKPLRDLDLKALALYDKLNDIKTFTHEPEIIWRTRCKVNRLSIQRETDDFVVDLCSRFPATVNTLMSTASKLSFARMPADSSIRTNLAVDANFCLLCRHVIFEFADIFNDKISDSSSFDYSRYCYGCRTILRDLENYALLPNLLGVPP